MPNLHDILARGYFPKELPSPFTTRSFATHMTTAVPGADFAKAIVGKPKIKSSKPSIYSHARGGLLRRKLSLCNPVAHYLLCREIVSDWAAIIAIAGGTVISATHPEDKATGRAIDGHHSQNARSELSQQTRLGKRYVLQADVSRFYSSIYTHSIPWAFHTKPIAKSNHSMSLLGNRLDFLVRLGQDQQTIGIPIGPDTSLVIAEVLMQRCDSHLTASIPSLKGSRFIDDFELSFSSHAEAEHAHYCLEACLSTYELALNSRKTHISELPIPLEAPWVNSLKEAKPRSEVKQQAADLSALFDLAFTLYREHPDDAIFQFAISLLRYETIHPENWLQFQRLLMLCAFPEPASFPSAIRQIIDRINIGFGPLIPEIEEIANALIVTHSPLRHSSEVANAIWAILALGLTMSDIAVDAVSLCDDAVVALLALDCEHRNQTSKPLSKAVWSTHMNADGLYDEFWILAYEANIKGWLPTQGIDFVAADANFSLLKAAGVSFYDASLVVPASPATQISSPAIEPVLLLDSVFSG